MMSKAAKSMRPRVYKAYKRINQLIEEYGKVRITFQNYYHIAGELGNDQRRRIIKKDGHCKVSYRGAHYIKWSGYSESCFLENRRDETLKQTLKAMMKHDGSHLIPIKIEYGLFYRKAEDLCSNPLVK